MKNCVKVKVNSIESAKEFSRICERFAEDIEYLEERTLIIGREDL